MKREEYAESALLFLRHLTARERAAVREELNGHIEDHIAALEERGEPPERAEERALAAMGDPAETGRALARQYPMGWLVWGRTAAILTVALALLLAGPLWTRAAAGADSLRVRRSPQTVADLGRQEDGSLLPRADDTEDTQLRVTLGDVHFWVYQVGIREGTVLLAVAQWRDDPFLDFEDRRIWMESESGDPCVGVTSAGHHVFLYRVETRPPERIVLTFDACGESQNVIVTPPWKEAGS